MHALALAHLLGIASACVARRQGLVTNAAGAPMVSLEGLTPAEARNGATYLTLMRQNLQALRAELGCT